MQAHRLRLQSAFAVGAVTASLLAVPIDAKAADPLLALMQGKWTATLVGNTPECGAESVLVRFILDANGQALGAATLTRHSTTCGDRVHRRRDVGIISIDAHGMGTAFVTDAFSGWVFNIQVADTGKTFILTDVVNTGNTLTGTAIHDIE